MAAGAVAVRLALLRTDPPEFEPRFIHRDFQLRNVLWSEGHVSGVFDWVETSIGPAWLDVAHCCTNIAIVHGNAAADPFAAAYVERTGREAQPYFDVMDVVGFLPPPGRDGFFKEDGKENRRLEELASVGHAANAQLRGMKSPSVPVRWRSPDPGVPRIGYTGTLSSAIDG